MNRLFDIFFQEDVLEGIHRVIRNSDFDIFKNDAETEKVKISASLLSVLVLLVAFGRSIYGQAEFSLIQHFVASFTIVFFSYVLCGLLLSIPIRRIAIIHHAFRCLITCLLISISLYLVLFPVTGRLNRAGVVVERCLKISTNGIVADIFPAVIFAVIGCLLVYLVAWISAKSKKSTNKSKKAHVAQVSSWPVVAVTFVFYLVITSCAFYFLIIDRGPFFVGYMSQVSSIQFK